jgi:hypothetical protein
MRDGLIAFAVLGVLMFGGPWLVRRVRQRASPAHVPPSDGHIVLRPPRRNAVMLGITALIPTALLGSLTARSWQLGRTGPAGLAAGVVATLLVLAVAVYQFAYAFRAHLLVHDTGIERVGVFRRRLVGWKRIAKIAFNPANHWFVVTVAGGSHMWLPADLAGMGDFAVVALRRIPPPVLQAADPVVREVLEELAAAVAPPRP